MTVLAGAVRSAGHPPAAGPQQPRPLAPVTDTGGVRLIEPEHTAFGQQKHRDGGELLTDRRDLEPSLHCARRMGPCVGHTAGTFQHDRPALGDEEGAVQLINRRHPPIVRPKFTLLGTTGRRTGPLIVTVGSAWSAAFKFGRGRVWRPISFWPW